VSLTTASRWTALLGLCAALLQPLAARSQTATATTLAAAPAKPAPPAAAAAPNTAAEYRLGSGDVLRIVVFQNPDLSLEARVSESGRISYPLLGSVRVGGVTVGEAEQLIAEGLRTGNFVRAPQVAVLVTQVRGNQANVLGQVNRPGRYPLEMAGMRLTDLLALAGGTAATGADRVVVVGVREGQPLRAEVDMPSLFGPGGADKDLVIQNGDSLWVDRQPVVYIYGEVQRPGPMRLEREMTLLQGLATGGGLTQRGTEKGIRVHRRGADGRIERLELRTQDLLRDGDVVHVPESLF
jgi:polysaccharide biosynthesis/export protein